jgi:DNA-binding GntR family transcriptional regulator
MAKTNPLRVLEPVNRPSVADSVFDELHRQIMSLELPPGMKMSEVDVAQALDVSRQPVRDAFYRLSKLGFLTIRPQRATTVSLISIRAVMQARFVRSAIEMETVRLACERLSDEDIDALEELIERQRVASDAGDIIAFHALDDQFHRDICEGTGHGFAWQIIRENKAHMDRVRLLSLPLDSGSALADHVEILAALRKRDPDLAAQMMRKHLSRILSQITRIRADYSQYFADEESNA